MIERLVKLQAERGRYENINALAGAVKNNTELQNEIRALTMHFLGRSVSGCSNCLCDAYMELLTIKKQTIMAKEEYRLRAGALLHDVVNADVSKNLTNLNMDENLALYHLRTNPDCRFYFERLPKDIEARIANIKVEYVPSMQIAGEVKEDEAGEVTIASTEEFAEVAEVAEAKAPIAVKRSHKKKK